MAESSSWTLGIDSEGIASLVFDTPGSSVNVLSSVHLREFAARLDEITAGRPTGVMISSGKAGFIAGADIKEFQTLQTAEAGFEMVRAGQSILQRLENLPCPTVAAIRGYALGGGLELALACRYRVGADDGRLSLGLPEVQLGIHPGFGGTVRAVRLMGVRAAMDLMLKGKPLNAQRALAAGLIDELVPAGELLDRARRLLKSPPPRKTAPLADKLLNLAPVRPFIARQIGATLRRKVMSEHYPAPYAMLDLWRRHGASGTDSYVAEARSIAALICSATSRNLVRVFMLQERLKSLGGASPFEARHVHVIGAGVMGGDIAAWAAYRGMTVTLQDRGAEFIQPALDRAHAFFRKRAKDPEAAAAAFGRLKMDVAGDGVADADVVIEAIFENLDAKRALYAELEPRLKPGALFATNTSSITLETLCEQLAAPERLVGIHFFNPVSQMQLIEIVKGSRTRADLMQSAASFTRKLDKLPLPCKSAPGFMVNRILMPYINEAIFALQEGIPAAVIDAAGLHFGMPMGPIELADVVGLDVCLHVGKVLGAAFGRSAPDLLDTLVAQKKIGRKSGEGFYRWVDGKPVRPASGPTQVPAELEDRLMLPLVNEAMACLREKVIEDADLLDAGAIFATGFAPFRGGPLQYARQRGAAHVRARLAELQLRHGDRFKPDAGWDLTLL
jgi:3-hydroxyacyl-CoA dehydrogenase/enoyl-CoA hydratase/3-hydroxybutyryl-CoA epimerase